MVKHERREWICGNKRKQSGKVETLNGLTNVLFILRCVTTSGMLSCKRQLANLVI